MNTRDTLTGLSHLSAALLIIGTTPMVADYIVSLHPRRVVGPRGGDAHATGCDLVAAD